MSSAGVQLLLSAMVTLAIHAITNKPRVLCAVEVPIWSAITTGKRIETFRWMPDEWIIPHEPRHPVHAITHIDIPSDTSGFDILMRLQPFLETAHRSVTVFSTVNSALMTLYGMEERSTLKQLVPVNYSFL